MIRTASPFLFTVAAGLFAAGCSTTPMVNGTVVDCFGDPVEGARVQVEGFTEHAMTDAKGVFEVPAFTGKKRVQAGKDGYILARDSYYIPEEEGKSSDPIKLHLYPDPEKPGFHLVNGDKYSELPTQMIDVVGTELHAYTGIKDHGEITVKPKDRMRFIFSTTRSRAQIAHLGLELHKLEFVENTPVSSVLGEQSVKVNRFVATESQEFELKELPSDDDWLIVTKKKLEPGVYAFHTEGLMTSKDVDALDKTPEELRQAYPFQIKE